MELEELIEVLEISVKKNGEKPLTNKYLLNILKLTQRRLNQEEIEAENYGLKQEYFWK